MKKSVMYWLEFYAQLLVQHDVNTGPGHFLGGKSDLFVTQI